VIEHFTRWQTTDNLRHWKSKLREGGLLLVEMPDLDKCIEWYLRGRDAPHINTKIGPQNMGKTQFYGNQWDRIDYETHRYVWTVTEFLRELNAAGFVVKEAGHDAKFHQKGRDMWVVASVP
jgi:predicted SAM-dependent methyltransferase